MVADKEKYTFGISLSVLDHLGRHLYRSFVTILGEAISNSWDADAPNVWIYVNKEKNSFVIKDDGIGMGGGDFQGKFLNIGYSKRKDKGGVSPGGRPFIGRKGIGKLALLSCAEKIIVASKVKDGGYVGGVIDNKGLDDAINEELTPQQYPLGDLDITIFEPFIKKEDTQGTLIYVENVKGGIKNTLELLKKIVALYFRFSLIDDKFNIYIDDEKITYKHLGELAGKTEFVWRVNDLKDPFVEDLETLPGVLEKKQVVAQEGISGFVASVSKYRDLNIMNLDEKVGIDLFVNGRLRERDILKRISKARVVEDYLYGQIHFNGLDEESVDRFTSSREGLVPDDVKYLEFLKNLEVEVLKIVISDWDKWRRKHRKSGDPENTSISPKERRSLELYNAVSGEYELPKGAKNKGKVDQWVDELSADAAFNFGSYAECFISENLIRKYMEEKHIALTPEAKAAAADWRKRETENKNKGNISIDIRRVDGDESYLAMSDLANLVDKRDAIKEACLSRDSNEYKPMRDAVAHTALLTDLAKSKLTSVYENIKGRIKTLLSAPTP